MKSKIHILLCCVFQLLFLQSFSQINVVDSSYTNWNGETFSTYLIEGTYTVLQIDKNYVTEEQVNDIETMAKIIEVIDGYYVHYKNITGREPVGGMSEYNFKSSVAFVIPSCGAACGLIGAKGIEVAPEMFQQIYGERKYLIATNRIGIVGYEFGRNFFTMGHKLLFPYREGTDDKNGGFAEGFASFTETLFFNNYVQTQPKEYSNFQETLYYYSQAHDAFRAYINDTLSNPYNTLAKERYLVDVNRNTWGFQIFAQSILTGTYELFKSDDLFSNFFIALDERSAASTIEEALGNIAYSFSKATNYDLSAYFQNVLKFNIDDVALNFITSLPKAPNRLIYDKHELWFTTPYDTIPLNIRSINYLNDNEIYQLYADGELISESEHGNNYLPYSILKAKDSIVLNTRLLNNSREQIDQQTIVLKKRHNINLNKYYKDFYLVEGNGHVRGYRENNDFILENFTNFEEFVAFEMAFPVTRDRDLYFEGSIRNENSNEQNLIDTNEDGVVDSYTKIMIGGLAQTQSVGFHIGINDNETFYDVSTIWDGHHYPATTNYLFNTLPDSINVWTQKVYLTTAGVTRGTFRNTVFKDLTDVDNDGIVDFEDNCFETDNSDQSDIDNDGIGDLCDDDIDGDGILNENDNCPESANEGQEDSDGDGIGDVCDDDDGDGVMNDKDLCSNTPTGETVNTDGCSESQIDDDGDGVMNDKDVCPDTPVGEPVDANGCIILGYNNFTIQSVGETCPDKNNGQLIISAEQNYTYSVTVNGASYTMNNTSDLLIDGLSPGTYEVCIEVVNQTSAYCYSLNIVEGTTVSGKADSDKNKTSVEIHSGTAPFEIFINGRSQFSTYSSSFDIATSHGDIIEVKTAVNCEGVYQKEVQVFDDITLYPNPTSGLLNIAIPHKVERVSIEIFNLNRQLVSKSEYPVIHGKVELDITDYPVGVYYVKVSVDKSTILRVLKI